ncbi:LTA synthase family protein [Achromobacter pestifer]|uniref:Sulfatase N-terminal domain-containing protein n=1 Tax=Achromobacter pestifer TaxID=1353889 RepID=A0A6S6YKC6_9BURK|nr:LTA synthase family protein [Achromobacter pestifer]CAB3626830.1 hypothetical protein LMG3431_00404 [Achromobacter pestifer]
MIDTFWIPLLPPYSLGLVLSLGVEALLVPRPIAPWRRQVAAIFVHLGVWSVAFAVELALFRRPYFGVVNVLALQLLVVLVSNAKFRALREPFVYPDFEYFLDAFRHPRLYLPFFGVGRALAAGGGYGAALWAGLALEDSVTAGAGVWLVSFVELPQEHMFDAIAPVIPFFGHTLILAVFGLGLAMVAGRKIKVEFDASTDLQRLGMIAALWAYGRSERLPTGVVSDNAPFGMKDVLVDIHRNLPDLLVVQSESFFDIRRTYPNLVRQEILANFDGLKVEAVAHGGLKVAAWGANTVRTEFAFLSGMKAGELGVHQYNPYRRLVADGFPTVVSYLKSLGYRTICVHPYHRSFYGRDRVLPLLGFDEFIGIEAFEKSKRDGAYVGDRALADHIIELMRQESTAALYVHVITMENHGPLHWESVDEHDAAAVLKVPLPPGCQDLVAYARHLNNADAMFGALRKSLLDRNRPSALCIFGDHVPIMPHVYAKLGDVDGLTDYVLWRSDMQSSPIEQSRDISTLADALLTAADVK